MDKKIKKITCFLGLISVFFLKAGSALALEVHYPSILGISINSTSSAPQYVCYLFSLLMNFAVFVAVLAVAWGGVQYIFGLGVGKIIDPAKGTRAPAEAREWLRAGISGLLIVVCSFLIASAINPNLTTCNLGVLSLINFNPPPKPAPPPGVNVVTYNEIPIGTLTEKLLTRTMDCYGFDQEGNPVDGNKISTSLAGPTYLNHDRADCILQLTDGAQKKGQVIASVSAEIKKLMDTCQCSAETCQDTCSGQNGCYLNSSTSNSPSGTDAQCAGDNLGNMTKQQVSDLCGGDCKKSKNPFCQQKQGTNDCCGTIPDPKNPNQQLSVKDMIEHGSLDIGVAVGTSSDCKTQTREYAGLDEFRSKYNNDYSRIKTFVETSDGLIKTGNCGTCVDKCQTCDPLSPTYLVCMAQRTTCLNSLTACRTKLSACQKNSPWYQLRLIDQMTYFKGKIDEMEKTIQDDKDMIDKAKVALGKCYLAIPYVDLLTIYQSTNDKKQIALTTKFSDSNGKLVIDPIDKNPIDASKYCTGFNYSNSSCLKKCNDACPDSSQQVTACYGSCKECDPSSPDYSDCLATQKKCINDCYNLRPCPNGDNPSQKFGDCITSCQNDCSNNCEKKYIPCSDEYNACKTQCGDNSQCVLDNSNSCLLNPQGFQQCGAQATDQGNAQYCIDTSYLCKNGSDEYAGYADCTQTVARPNAQIKDMRDEMHILFPLTWWLTDWLLTPPPVDCSKNHSASFLFAHPECEKCLQPYGQPDSGSVCYSTYQRLKSIVATGATCQQLCPEVTKCPTASTCPYCPCASIDQTLNFSVPSTDIGQYTTSSEKVQAQEIVGPQCNNYSYNDDPLTFYCENDPWKDPTSEVHIQNAEPLGTELDCPKQGEVPVGQTVDDAENWADTLIKSVDIINGDKGVQGMIDQMVKLGKAIEPTNVIHDYCKCDAKLDTDKPICTTDCQYSQTIEPKYDPDTGEQTGFKYTCSCGVKACAGSPCTQMTDYLLELWSSYANLKKTFIDFYTTMITEPRSDIMKELAYSRKTVNSCSSAGNASNARLLSCTRAEDELIPSINTGQIKFNGQTFDSYCYGQSLGKLFHQSVTDNWFCCQGVQ